MKEPDDKKTTLALTDQPADQDYGQGDWLLLPNPTPEDGEGDWVLTPTANQIVIVIGVPWWRRNPILEEPDE